VSGKKDRREARAMGETVNVHEGTIEFEINPKKRR
jgi:hypothetical protein